MESEKLQSLVDMDDKFKAVQDVKTERWTKMLFNGAWNPIAALTGLDTHQLLGKPIYLEMIQRLVEEIYTVAVKSGAVLPADLPARTVQFPQTAAPIIPSMLQDAKHKRTMEIEALCGNIWRQADIVGVPVPAVEATYEALVEMDKGIQWIRGFECTRRMSSRCQHAISRVENAARVFVLEALVVRGAACCGEVLRDWVKG